MSKPTRAMSFRQQMRKSMADLKSIMEQNESPSGNGRFTVRTSEVVEPSEYSAKAVIRTRNMLKVSQSVFAQILGVSPALVRAWERGARKPSPIARRLLDQVRGNPSNFRMLIRRTAA